MTQDVITSKGAKEEKAQFKLHTKDLCNYEADLDRGWLISKAGFGGGTDYWKVSYTAGYSTVPEDVQEAVCQWIVKLFWMTKRDPGLQQNQIPGVQSFSAIQGIPDDVKIALRPYKAHKLFNFGG